LGGLRLGVSGNIKKARGILANQLKTSPAFACLWRVAISLEESEKQFQQARWLYAAGECHKASSMRIMFSFILAHFGNTANYSKTKKRLQGNSHGDNPRSLDCP
jgi:hypothetical protein